MGEAMNFMSMALIGILFPAAALAQPARTVQGDTHPACTDTSTNLCQDNRSSTAGSTSISNPDVDTSSARSGRLKSVVVRDMYGMSDLGVGGIGGSGRR
jgi:hypothetical protein